MRKDAELPELWQEGSRKRALNFNTPAGRCTYIPLAGTTVTPPRKSGYRDYSGHLDVLPECNFLKLGPLAVPAGDSVRSISSAGERCD